MAKAGSVVSASRFRTNDRPGKLRELLRCGGKRRSDTDVSGAVEDRLPYLFDSVRADADDRVGTDDAPRFPHGHVFLPQMHAIRFSQPGQIGATG